MKLIMLSLTLCTRETLLTSTFANSADPDEMQLHAAFRQGQHCLLMLKQPSGTEIHHDLETSNLENLPVTP